MRVLVYVEGPADKVALEKLLRNELEQGRKSKVGISFISRGGKDWILEKLGWTAANHLMSNPEDYVFALPDLYPMAKYERTERAHHSFSELKQLLWSRFHEEAEKMGLPAAVRTQFRVHCLKHDLEVLLLGAVEPLRRRLKTDEGIEKNWCKPVENQNDSDPPKRVVERLFMKYRKQRYSETTDAPWILERAVLSSVSDACPQNFKPFVTELNRLIHGESLE